MAGFNFAKRSDILAVLKLLNELSPRELHKLLPVEGTPSRGAITKGWIFQTPSGGIDARSGTTCGKADCTPYYIDDDDDLVELTDNDGSSFTVEVFHIGGSAVAGSTYIQAKECFGLLVADFEDCG